MTYDHLLAQGERLVEMMRPAADADAEFAVEVDDIPW